MTKDLSSSGHQSAEYYKNLGDACFNNQDYSQAMEHYLRAIELDGSKFAYHGKIGSAYHALERYTEAIEAYSKVLELDPHPQMFSMLLGKIYTN